MLQEVAGELRRQLYEVDGAIVEAKGLSLSVHYRLVIERDRPLVRRQWHAWRRCFPPFA